MSETMIRHNQAKTLLKLLSGTILALAVFFCWSGSARAAEVSDQAGLEAALGGTDDVITLTGDITLTKNITVSRAVTLSGGDAITLDTAGYSLIVASGGNLTVDGALTITGSGEQTIRVKDNGIFTLENGTIESLSIDWHSAIYIEDGGTVNINGGAVLDLYNKFSEGAIYANGGIVTVNVSGGVITGYSHGIKLFHYDSTDSRSTVTVSGGTITTTVPETAAQTYGVRVEKGNVKIDGDAEINALFPVAVDVGSMDISDGTINGNLSLDTCPTVISGGTVNGYIDISDTNTVTITGGTFNNIILNNCGTVEISGGTFTSSNDVIGLSGCGDTAISGGTFSGSVGINVYSIDSGKSVSISGDAEIMGTLYGVYGSSSAIIISGKDVAISGEYGLYVAGGCTVTVSGGTITGNSYGSIFINGGALTLTGGTIMNTTNESENYGIYIQEGPTNNEITSTEDLVISAHAPLFYKGSSCFDSLPGPQKLAVGETKYVRVMGYDTSEFDYTVDTENTSAELNASKENSTTFPIAPTAAGDYVLVLSGRKSGEDAFLKLTIPVEVVYSLTYDANGGTGTAPAKEYLDAAETFTTAPWNTFTPPPGKQFKEWNTAADGTGTAYSANTTVAMPANNLTLYAIWEDIPDTTYIANIDPASKTFTAAVVNYSQQAAQEFTITNTGTGTITGLSAVLSGENFEISAALSASSLNAGGTATVSVRPKTGLAAGTYTDTLTITGDNGISLTAGLSFTVNPATYGIDLDKTGIHTFTGKTAGYDSVTPLTVTITNVGNQATGDLTCTLGGTDPNSYTLSNTAVDSIAVGGSDTFTVVPKMGLAAGTYTATVTVSGGGNITAQTFTASFTVDAVPVATYTVTFESNGSVYATKTVNAGESIGNAAWPANPARNNYTFGGWFTGENGTGTQFTSETPVNAAMTVYAKWTYSGGGGGGGGGSTTKSTPTTPAFNAVIQAGSGPAATLPVTVDTKSGTAHIDIGSHKLTSEGTVITIPSIPDVDTYSVGIPVQNLATAGQEGLTVETAQGTIIVPSNILTGISGINGSQAEISTAKGDKDNLPDDVKSAIGDKPLIQLTLSIDGRQTEWNNPDAPVTVSIPYTPTAEELANPESIVVWYIDGSGNVVTIPNGHYDPATGNVTFTTTHFSYYAVSYKQVSFSDVAADAWYERAVSFIAAREITTGTGSGNFSPEAKLTRGQFIVMLMKAYGMAPDANPKDNFSDAGSTWYTGYLAAAKKLGISAGIGNNLFAPEKEITRQEMFTLLHNALKVIGQLPEGSSGKTLADFADSDAIAPWAKGAMKLLVEAGTLGGSDGKLTPQGTTTRAEMAQVLYNLLGK
ncbi:MAG: hypothetical protein GX918_09600 [Clostridiales bacterium]|nr:hypothetical protein [Clostridiales bacterium]